MAAVCGFEAFINVLLALIAFYLKLIFAQGKHVIGKVEEKEAAHKAYKEAVSQGHGAYLLDEEKPDVFSVSVGNLPPKADIVIKIKYITELSVDGDDVSPHCPHKCDPSFISRVYMFCSPSRSVSTSN